MAWRRRRPRRAVVLAISVALVTGACSGSSEQSEPVAEADPTPTPEPTTEPTATPDPSPTATPTPEPTATPDPTPAPAPTATPEPDDLEATLAEVWDRAWRDVFLGPGRPENPDLALRFTGEAFNFVRALLADREEAGTESRLPEGSIFVSDFRLNSTDGQRAEGIGCAVDDGVVVDLQTGEVLDDDVVSSDWLIVYELTDEGWKILGFERLAATEGASCDV